MPTVQCHPLAEVVARCLFGIEGVPPAEARKMADRAASEAAKWYDERIRAIKDAQPKTKFDGRYSITANELHCRLVDSMLVHLHHMEWPGEDIVNSHDKHPLEQIINSLLWTVHQHGVEEGMKCRETTAIGSAAEPRPS